MKPTIIQNNTAKDCIIKSQKREIKLLKKLISIMKGDKDGL